MKMPHIFRISEADVMSTPAAVAGGVVLSVGAYLLTEPLLIADAGKTKVAKARQTLTPEQFKALLGPLKKIWKSFDPQGDYLDATATWEDMRPFLKAIKGTHWDEIEAQQCFDANIDATQGDKMDWSEFHKMMKRTWDWSSSHEVENLADVIASYQASGYLSAGVLGPASTAPRTRSGYVLRALGGVGFMGFGMFILSQSSHFKPHFEHGHKQLSEKLAAAQPHIKGFTQKLQDAMLSYFVWCQNKCLRQAKPSLALTC